MLAWITQAQAGQPDYPDLRDSHDPALQAELDAALSVLPNFQKDVRNKKLSAVVADVTDLEHPKVAGFNPDLMLYAASLPKVAIALAALVEIDQGRLKMDDKLHSELVNMIKRSSNRDATAVLNKVGMDRLQQILQDKRYGELYDPAHGGGLWVGKPYAKAGREQREPLKHLSHAASAMQVARLYYGLLNGSILGHRHDALLREMFGEPGISHKFVKGLEGRLHVRIYRKSGTWRDFHADAALVERDKLSYIVVAIDHSPQAGLGFTKGIRIVDDLMLERVATDADK